MEIQRLAQAHVSLDKAVTCRDAIISLSSGRDNETSLKKSQSIKEPAVKSGQQDKEPSLNNSNEIKEARKALERLNSRTCKVLRKAFGSLLNAAQLGVRAKPDGGIWVPESIEYRLHPFI